MRKLLNTIYVTNPNSYLSLDGENLVVLLENDEKFRLPFVNIENIVCFAYMGASPALMGKCCDQNIGLVFLKPTGQYLARVEGKTTGNVNLRMQQYRLSEKVEFCLKFAKNTVAAKIFNTRFSLERSIRDNAEKIDTSRLKAVSAYIKENLDRGYDFEDIEQLRGFEGIIARRYFEVFSDMILKQKQDFDITSRSKRPPLDNVNCMLSYLYTILSFEIVSALESVGLDPYVGFYHKLRVGRRSLALDIVEELRAFFVDRLVITLINTGQITKKDFLKKEGGGILMTDECRKKLLGIWQERKREEINHPIIDEKIEIGLVPYVQSQLLARHIRGDMDEYPPFICR